MSWGARIAHVEKRVSAAQEERAGARVVLPFDAAKWHATAAAGIVLAGKPKIDEPLIQAWTRTLQHYEIAVQEPAASSEQVRAARMLDSIIIGKATQSSRFAEIFRTAPAWLLHFTRMALDAWILKFHLPEMGANLKWSGAGFADAERWPSLPVGVMTAGDRIPRYDRRQAALAILSVGPPDGDIPNIFDQPPPEEINLSRFDQMMVEDLCLAASLNDKPEKEWSAYERRRMRRFARLIDSL